MTSKRLFVLRGKISQHLSPEYNKMRLYIDTSDAEKIKIKVDGEEFVADSRVNKAQMLLPFIVDTLKKKKMTVHDLTEIGVFTGPGSFTGLRVGVAVANALGWSLGGIHVNGKNLDEGESVTIKYE